MIRFVKRLWAAAPVATVILAAALVVAGFFAVRMTAFWIYWRDPARHEQVIEGWMTPGYIAHSWKVPRDVVFDALDAPKPRPGSPKTLNELAELRGVPVDALIATADAAIATYRAGEPDRE